MRLPSKNTSFSDSIMAKFPVVLRLLKNSDMSVAELYRSVKGVTGDISEFVEILDCLYALGQIEYSAETRSLRYVG